MSRNLQVLVEISRKSVDELSQGVVTRVVLESGKSKDRNSSGRFGKQESAGSQGIGVRPAVVTPSAEQPHQRPASPEGESSTGNDLLSALHLRWLERVCLHPEETISQRAAADHLDRMEEWRIRTHLVRLGYAKLAGKIGKVEFYGLTDGGIALMRTRGIVPESQKSGVLHEICARLVLQDVQRYPSVTVTRGGAFAGVQPDLMLTTSDGGCVPLQVSVTNAASYEAGCALRLAALAPVTRVLVICTTQEKVKAVQKALRLAAEQPGGLFSPAGEMAKVLVLHAEDVLQQRLDWLAFCTPKAASQGHPDQVGGVLGGEAAEARGSWIGLENQGEEGSREPDEQGREEMADRQESGGRPAEEAEDTTGGERLREPEGEDEALEGFQERQDGRGPGGEQEVGTAEARPEGRAEGLGRGPGTEAGRTAKPDDQEKESETGRGPRERGPRTGDGTGTEREAAGSDTESRTETEVQGVSSDQGRTRKDAKKQGREKNFQPEAGDGVRQEAEKGPNNGPRRARGRLDTRSKEGAATVSGGIREGGATGDDGRTTTNVEEEVRKVEKNEVRKTEKKGGEKEEEKEGKKVVEKKGKKEERKKEKEQGRNLNLKHELEPYRADRLLLTFREAAELCSVSQKTISRAVKAGHLTAIQAPGTRGVKGRRIAQAELDSWQSRQTQEAEKARAAVRETRGPSEGQ